MRKYDRIRCWITFALLVSVHSSGKLQQNPLWPTQWVLELSITNLRALLYRFLGPSFKLRYTNRCYHGHSERSGNVNPPENSTPTLNAWRARAAWTKPTNGAYNTRISGTMTGALTLYSATFMRYSMAVTPRNWLLFGCHFINTGSQITQGYRYLQYWQ